MRVSAPSSLIAATTPRPPAAEGLDPAIIYATGDLPEFHKIVNTLLAAMPRILAWHTARSADGPRDVWRLWSRSRSRRHGLEPTGIGVQLGEPLRTCECWVCWRWGSEIPDGGG
ncbi:MAG: hypothetical protein OXE75_04310 [bacterium]|nr:hypothetical protein [bacterium]